MGAKEPYILGAITLKHVVVIGKLDHSPTVVLHGPDVQQHEPRVLITVEVEPCRASAVMTPGTHTHLYIFQSKGHKRAAPAA